MDKRDDQSRPERALEAYVAELRRDYLPWYEKASSRNFYLWLTLQTVTVFAGIATAIVAALMNVVGDGHAWPRVFLIVVPLLGSLAATVAVQVKVLDRNTLREQGRQTIQGLIVRAEKDLAAAAAADDITKIHERLIEAVQRLEAEQALEFNRLAAGAVTSKPKT